MKFTLTNVLVKASFVFTCTFLFIYLPVEGQIKPDQSSLSVKQNSSISFLLSGDEVLQENHDSWAAACADFDQDGDIDLFIPARSTASISQLLINDGEGQFESVYSDLFESNIGNTNGAVWADFNNDGQDDLFVCRGGNASNMMLTLQDEQLQELPINPLLSNDLGNQLSTSYIDVNNDGALDLFLCNFDQFVQNRLFLGDGSGGFERQNYTRVGLETSFSVASAWQDFDLDGLVDLIVCNTNATENFLYRNVGNGHFERVQDQAISTLNASSVGASWGDYDNDGDPDLFIANSGNQNNHLFRNDNGQFTRILGQNLVMDSGHSHGSVWADLDNDGWLDLYVSNDQGQPNFLYINNQDGTFTRKENFGGLQNNSLAVLAADFNSDLKLDLFEVTRGSVPNALLLNATENNNRAVQIKLIGTHSNRSAIGARIKLTATINSQTITQSRQVNALSGGGVGGQSPLAQHFGMGNASSIQTLEIYWPSGQVQTLSNLNILENPLFEIVEPTGTKFYGLAFHDANENCIQDQDEAVIPNLPLTLLNGDRNLVTNENGSFETFLEMGNYSYGLKANSLWELNNCGQLPFFSINGQNFDPNGLEVILPVNFKCPGPEVNLDLISGEKRLGEVCISVIRYENKGPSKATELFISYDPGQGVVLDQAFPVWTYIDNGVYYWDLGLLSPFEVDKIFLRELIPASLNGGSQIIATAGSSFKELDCFSDNNSATRTHSFSTLGLMEGEDSNKSETPAITWSSAVKPKLADQVQVFPNPVLSDRSISLDLPKVASGSIRLEWIDQLGRIRQIQDYATTGGLTRVSTRGLEPGIYWIRFYLNEEWIVKKIMINPA